MKKFDSFSRMGRLSFVRGLARLPPLSNWNGLNWFWLTDPRASGERKNVGNYCFAMHGEGLDHRSGMRETEERRHFSAVRFRGLRVSDHVGAGKLGSHAALIKTDLFPSQTMRPGEVDGGCPTLAGG